MGDVFVKFRYEERDVESALRSQLFATYRKRLDIALAPLVVIVLCVMSYRIATGVARALIAAFAALVVMLVVAAIVLVPKIMFRRRPSLRAPMTVDASDEGITVTTGAIARTIAWSDVGRVETGGRVVMLHHGEEVLLVPRRAFRNAERERAFLDLLKRAATSVDWSPENPRRARTSKSRRRGAPRRRRRRSVRAVVRPVRVRAP